jgi:ATP-binding cassette subfamily B protein
MRRCDMAEKKKLSRASVVKYNLWLFKLIWKHTPGYIIGMIAAGVLWGINNAIGSLYTLWLFDALGEGRGLRATLSIIGGYAIYLSVFHVFNYWYWRIYNPKVRERLHIRLHSDMFRQALRIDLEKYDDPEFYNDFIFSMDTSFSHVTGLVEDTGKLINRIVASLTLTGVLFSIDALMATIIFAVSVLRIVLSTLKNKSNFRYSSEINNLSRKDAYIKRVFKLPDYAKELRTTHVRENLLREHERNTENKLRVIKRYGTQIGILLSIIAVVNEATTIGLMILMLYKVMVTGSVGLGGFAVAMNAVWRVSWLLSDLVDRVMKYHEHGLYIEKMMSFMQCEPKIVDGTLEAGSFERLCLKGLEFSYTENAPRALDGVDIEIKRGEKIAIVGYNGAGKTTLTKLIMRLYDPTSGEILYNGKQLSDYTVGSLRGRMAAVFQDWRIFAGSIAENVVGGEYDPRNEDRVLAALQKSTFDSKLDKLTHGLDTQLTKEFEKEGTQLSGGESQKIAIARAFYKDADLIILDEPSSALDPDAEYSLNQAIAQYAEGRTVIFISHRLSTTRHADRIYMFDSGKLVESGTHDELISLGGKYAYMFNLQAEKYR